MVDRRHERPVTAGVLVVCAGTADLPVACEAAVTAEAMDCAVERAFDVGVAGVHRLLDRLPTLQKARVIIAVAGMEGALPSVVGGLVQVPVIAVPTSVGYGASFQGLAALLRPRHRCRQRGQRVRRRISGGAHQQVLDRILSPANRCRTAMGPPLSRPKHPSHG